MEERNHTTAPDTAEKSCSCCGWGAFVVGLVVALILGWWALPNLMKVEKKQPIAFNHVLHTEQYGMECSSCHFFQDSGNFVGLPTTETCAECHFEVIGEHPEEVKFVNEYVKTGREIQGEWLVYQKQPDNVFFSHAAHSYNECMTCHTTDEKGFETAEALCAQCHLPVFSMTSPPVYKENRLSGYTDQTMIMWQCERCHAEPNHLEMTRTSNACFVCHK